MPLGRLVATRHLERTSHSLQTSPAPSTASPVHYRNKGRRHHVGDQACLGHGCRPANVSTLKQSGRRVDIERDRCPTRQGGWHRTEPPSGGSVAPEDFAPESLA